MSMCSSSSTEIVSHVSKESSGIDDPFSAFLLKDAAIASEGDKILLVYAADAMRRADL